ncbi:hypothetical protein [Methanothermobacter tenebrarum]|uniref:UPF0282 protein DPC56_02065 n=1 Tax=Methanothermobacter tenebrarum TaxID=680118 RepID=A0A328PIR7_9EURY|nr:hypothetical protein [Methanothermobacter tenebrarum]MBC7101410.1 hypothetical protein [Methanobacteriales archaeon]NPV65221.1 hypothetical protein [Methanobacteriaceae archaeon]RAO79586.1 hypothetical protein DPC56_02065 [Methanothermobacter tenebrarum]
MKIIPLASESLGVRSLAVYIKTEENNILIDPGAALGPKRYSLPPAKVEIERLKHARKKILEFLAITDTIIISHYHYDHYIPGANYDGKHLFLKDPIKNINKSQKSRASKFLKDKREYEYADGKIITKDFRMEFSPALPHGEKGTKLGFVIMTLIDHKKRMIHASDTQLLNKESVKWIIEKMPDLIITSGPPTYIGYMKDSWKTGTKNINQIIRETDAKIILDHHIIRDKRYPRFFEGLEKEPLTFAGYLGVDETPLEAYRRELHKIENGERIRLPFNI